MGHDGMLYSLPSRELIADSVDYMVQAHKADALICISNCDKITPGMLLAALRLNLPTIFVSGGPMEAGKTKLSTGPAKLDLIDPMIVVVYLWADAAYFNVRLQKDRPCVRVVVGATENGHKELLAIQDGERESHLSWLHLILRQEASRQRPLQDPLHPRTERREEYGHPYRRRKK